MTRKLTFTISIILLHFLLYSINGFALEVSRGPYIQNGTQSSAIIRWRTDLPSDSRLRYGSTPGNLNQTITQSSNKTEHELQVTGLNPNTKYYYAIGSSSGDLAGDDSEHYFVTLPVSTSSQPIRFWVLGDSGTADSNAAAVRNAYLELAQNEKEADFFLMLGDNAYQSGTDNEFQAAVFDMYPSILRNKFLWSTVGNHEYQSTNAQPYFDNFTFPISGEAGGVASGTERYYSYDYGPVHFICLDSYAESTSEGSTMRVWLENDLSSTTKNWIVAFFHHPPYTDGSHSDTIKMRDDILPVLENGGVDLVLSGHSHGYERSYLLNQGAIFDNLSGQLDSHGSYVKNIQNNDGVVCIVAGSSGKTSSGGYNHPKMYTSAEKLGSLIIDVSANQLDVRFLREHTNPTQLEDYFSIVKNDLPSTVPNADAGSNQSLTDTDDNGSESVTLNGSSSTDSDGTIQSYEWKKGPTVLGSTAVLNTTLNVGIHTITLQVTDNSGYVDTDTVNIEVLSSSGTLNTVVSVNNGPDDAEEYPNGTVNIDSSDLELTYDLGAEVNQTIGLRFTQIDIPQGANIVSATVQFQTDEVSTGASSLTIKGQATDNPVTFSESLNNITSRPTTNSSVNWNPSDWTTVGESQANQQTPDIKSVIQEIVNRSGWTNQNALVLLITGSGTRTAESYNGSQTGSATLSIEWTSTPQGNQSPVANAGPDQNIVDADQNGTENVTLNGSSSYDPDGSIQSYEWKEGQNILGTTASINSNFSLGEHTITLTVTDNEGATNSDTVVINIQDPQSTNDLYVQISSNNDDAEEFENLTVYLDSSDLELTQDNGFDTNQTVGLRFNNIDIPQGANIISATVQFQTDEVSTGAASIDITAEATDNALAFSSSTSNLTARTPTTASINWTPNDWAVVGERNSNQLSPNLSPVIQEVINRSGWTNNNSLVLLITGSGTRTAESYDGSASGAPELHIEWSIGTPSNQSPIANAGPDQNIVDADQNGSESVTLDGSLSSDPDGSIQSYEWKEGQNILGTSVTLNTSFNVGQHTVTLTVTDNEGATNTDTVIIDILPSNQPPVANAGPDQNIIDSDQNGSESVTLDGSLSSDPDGSIQTYEWKEGQNIIGTGVTLNTTFNVGLHTVTLTVTDNEGATNTDTVIIDIQSPQANSLDVKVASGIDDAEEFDDLSVYTNSSDLELIRDDYYSTDQIVGLRFNNITIPQGATITAATIQFQTDEISTGSASLNFQAEAIDHAPTFSSATANLSSRTRTTSSINWVPNDWNTVGERSSNQLSSDISPVIQEVINRSGWNSNNSLVILMTGSGARIAESYEGSATGAPELHIEWSSGSPSNQSPIANAGPDQTQTDLNNDGSETVILDGSQSSDPDGSIQSYEWKEGQNILGTGVSISPALNVGSHNITLTVTDDQGATNSDTVVIDILPGNTPPTANAGPDQNLVDIDSSGDESVTLDGSASFDSDGTIQSYEWKEGQNVLGTGITLVTTLNIGLHNITLTVTDDQGATSSDIVTIDIIPTNTPPVANAGPDQGLVDVDSSGDESVTLDGSASFDPDGSIQSYEWKEGQNTLGTGITLIATLTIGQHTITLTVTDNEGATHSDTVIIDIIPSNTPPIANAGPDQNLIDQDFSGDEWVTLDGSASSDPDGSIQSYEWKEGQNILGTSSTLNTLLNTGTHNITLTVTDNEGATNSDTVTITINSPSSNSLEVSIAQGSNDAEEFQNGNMYLTSSDLELIRDDYYSTDQWIGLRFTNITIPQGATITQATLQFQTDEISSGACNIVIQAEANDNPGTFTTTAFDISSRPRTSASANWAPSDWTVVGEQSSAQLSDDFSTVLQEIINRPNWINGNSIVLILSGSGTRIAESYEGSIVGAPKLNIEWQ